MRNHCHRCYQPIPEHAAVMSGAGVDRRATCSDCYTVLRAVSGIVVVEVPATGPLTRRMQEAGLL